MFEFFITIVFLYLVMVSVYSVIGVFTSFDTDDETFPEPYYEDKSNSDLMRTRHIDNQRIDAENKAKGRPYREDV